MRRSLTAWIATVGVAAGLFAASPALAASVPAWLDDAISTWNAENPAVQIEFVDIKDSFVWYMIPATEEISHPLVRERVYNIVMGHGYQMADDEEMVTTGKPPSMTTPYKAKKCWSRSYVLDIEALSNTTAAGNSGRGEDSGVRQRMLTSLVCDDNGYWFAGFRILQ